jgi:hypothetical protein
MLETVGDRYARRFAAEVDDADVTGVAGVAGIARNRQDVVVDRQEKRQPERAGDVGRVSPDIVNVAVMDTSLMQTSAT